MDEPCSMSAALSLLSEPNYGNRAIIDEKIIKIKFKINEKLDDQLNETSFKHHFQAGSSVLITFDATAVDGESKVFWKLHGQENFKLLRLPEDLDGTVTEYCRNYLEISLMNGNIGE